MTPIERLLSKYQAAEERVATLTGTLKAAKEDLEGLRDEVMKYMDEHGLSMLSAGGYVADIDEDDKPQLTDWNDLVRYLLRSKRLDLFQRRISSAVWKELVEASGKPVPGISTFTYRTIKICKAK